MTSNGTPTNGNARRRPRWTTRRALAVGLVPALVLMVAISAGAAASGSKTSRASFNAPTKGYVVYWDQDEEVDYYESANHSQGQLETPWDLNGQVCLLNDGTGRWVGGADPTNESQHNP